MDEDLEPIVCDFGTSTVKVGFAGEDAPAAVYASVVGHPKAYPKIPFRDRRVLFGGDDMLKDTTGRFTLNWPIDGGIVVDWDDMEQMYSSIYTSLQISDQEPRQILLTEHALKHDANVHEKKVHRNNREKMCEVMFESMNVPAMYVSPQPVLAILATGRESGFVLESGVKNTRCVPIFEGQLVPYAIKEFSFAGRGLTDHLTDILSEKGYSFTTQAERRIVNDIKEKLGYVAMDYDEEVKTSKTSTEMTKNYELPDGQLITIGAERFQCGEAFFKPSLAGMDTDGIHEIIHSSIMMCHEDIRQEISKCFAICGCSTMLTGFVERILKELNVLTPSLAHKNIFTLMVEKMYAVWIGGSILASLSTFQEMLVKKLEYDENGPTIVHDRCY